MSNDTKTTLVIGAGASAIFGLPTGFQLRQKLLSDETGDITSAVNNSLRLDNENYSEITTESDYGNEPSYSDFQSELLNSGNSSIDQFLTYRTNYRDIGKRAIAAALLPAEQNAIRERADGWDWLSWLFDRIIPDPDAHPLRNIQFVTFNYDRLIEYSFAIMARSRFGLNTGEVSNLVKRLRIHHVYGTLGSDTFKYRKLEKTRFNLEMPNFVTNAATTGIQVIPEIKGKTLSPTTLTARESLDEANRIIFLGFGYNPDNMKLIGMADGAIANSKTVLGTSFGMKTAERKQVNKLFGKDVLGNVHDVNCLDFLREFVVW